MPASMKLGYKYLSIIKNQIQNPAPPTARAAQGFRVLCLTMTTYLEDASEQKGENSRSHQSVPHSC
jgi:hypothetical protein